MTMILYRQLNLDQKSLKIYYIFLIMDTHVYILYITIHPVVEAYP